MSETPTAPTPDEDHLDWDRDQLGSMADYATDPDDEPALDDTDEKGQ